MSQTQQQSNNTLLEKVATTENIEALCKFTKACNLLAEVCVLDSAFVKELAPNCSDEFLAEALENLNRMNKFIASIGGV